MSGLAEAICMHLALQVSTTNLVSAAAKQLLPLYYLSAALRTTCHWVCAGGLETTK